MANTELGSQLTDRTQKEKWILILLPILAAAPLIAGSYISFLFAQYLFFALLALSLGFIWGYGGILSFGHAAFFGLGAYSMAWSQEYVGFLPTPGYAGLVGAAVIPTVLALFLGLFLFYSDVKDVYFVIITLSVSVLLEQLATSSGIMFQIFGGFNGLYVDRIPLVIPGVVKFQISDRIHYILAVVVVVGGYLLCRQIIRSHFGDVLIAIRENEERTKAFGYDTAYYKTLGFGFSAALAGVGGALYASLAGFIDPSLLGFVLSTEIIIWVAVGGRQYLVGAILGAILVNAASTGLSQVISTRYILILGVVFILVVVFFKQGIAGLLINLVKRGEKQ
jgi:urea ABC transporter permease protein UrtC